MAETKVEKHQCAPENARRFWEWIRDRGGLAIWNSVNLSNPGASWTTPVRDADGKPVVKPTWQAGETPGRIITDPDDVEVVEGREVKRFHIAIRMGSQGLMLKVTDGGTRRIRAAVANAGPDAWYEFDYSTQEAVIFVPGERMSLREWAARQGEEVRDGDK